MAVFDSPMRPVLRSPLYDPLNKGVQPSPGYVFLRGKQPDGSYVILRGKQPDGSYVNLQGKVN